MGEGTPVKLLGQRLSIEARRVCGREPWPALIDRSQGALGWRRSLSLRLPRAMPSVCASPWSVAGDALKIASAATCRHSRLGVAVSQKGSTVLKLAIIIGSTRPGRIGESVARWVYERATTRGDAEFELVDLLDYNLPLLDEPIPPSQGKYSRDHTKKWAAKVASFDGYVFVTPEYNHGTSGALKNAIDFVYRE